jgi:hypothetical protein
MRKITQQLYSFALAGILVFSVFTGISFETPIAQAQCTAESGNGNLEGYAVMSNIPNGNDNRIYMSTESWNDEESTQTGESFGVTYNRQTDTWGGKGWSSEFGWVDFGEINSNNVTAQRAQFTEMVNDPNGYWGNWDADIDLSDVDYSSDPGGFSGYGVNGGKTATPDDTLDSPVGVGFIDFSNVVLNNNELPCNEYVDVTLNNVNILQQENCNIPAPRIRWRTTNVVPGTCETVAGLWQGPTGASKPDDGAENATGDITATNSPQVFRLKCERQSSPGNYVYGEAYAICGETIGCDPNVDPNCSPIGGGIVIPEFKEV